MQRFLNILIALVIISTIVVGVMRIQQNHTSGTAQQATSKSFSLEPIRIGEVVYHNVTLDIPRDVPADSITDVQSSCGCAKLSLWSLDKTRHVIHATLKTQPDAYTTAGVATTLSIYADHTIVDDVSVTSDIQSPFVGWPDAAQGSIDTNTYRLVIHGAYGDVPLTFQCYDKDENEITVQRPSQSEIMIAGIQPEKVSQYTLVVSFAFDKDNPTVWAGPLAVSAGE